LERWFRNELRDYSHQVLLDPIAIQRGYFRPEATRRLLEEHDAGTFDHSYRLWGLLFFELWARQWLDNRSLSPTPSVSAAL